MSNKVEEVAKAGLNPIGQLSKWGVKSEHAYLAGFASVVLSTVSWAISRRKTSHSKSQSDRWGLFVGEWAPTLMAIGLALKHEEKK